MAVDMMERGRAVNLAASFSGGAKRRPENLLPEMLGASPSMTRIMISHLNRLHLQSAKLIQPAFFSASAWM